MFNEIVIQKELLDPAIKGTINVLTAAKDAGVRRVVVTSSISAITPSPNWPSDVVKTEDCWTDLEYCKRKKVGFFFYLKIFTHSISLKFAMSKISDCYIYILIYLGWF